METLSPWHRDGVSVVSEECLCGARKDIVHVLQRDVQLQRRKTFQKHQQLHEADVTGSDWDDFRSQAIPRAL